MNSKHLNENKLLNVFDFGFRLHLDRVISRNPEIKFRFWTINQIIDTNTIDKWLIHYIE
jgi:hypothetical protein